MPSCAAVCSAPPAPSLPPTPAPNQLSLWRTPPSTMKSCFRIRGTFIEILLSVQKCPRLLLLQLPVFLLHGSLQAWQKTSIHLNPGSRVRPLPPLQNKNVLQYPAPPASAARTKLLSAFSRSLGAWPPSHLWRPSRTHPGIEEDLFPKCPIQVVHTDSDDATFNIVLACASFRSLSSILMEASELDGRHVGIMIV